MNKKAHYAPGLRPIDPASTYPLIARTVASLQDIVLGYLWRTGLFSANRARINDNLLEIYDNNVINCKRPCTNCGQWVWFNEMGRMLVRSIEKKRGSLRVCWWCEHNFRIRTPCLINWDCDTGPYEVHYKSICQCNRNIPPNMRIKVFD